MGDPEVTTMANGTNLSDDISSMILENGYAFHDLFDTPNRDEIKKDPEGKKTKPLSSIVVAQPVTTKILDKYKTIAHKVEAKLKLESKTDDGKSYVPGSLRKKNAI